MLQLRQGKLDLPLEGGPDLLRAAALVDEAPDDHLTVRDGDNFVVFMAWDRQGRFASRLIQPFAAATFRPSSLYYADQAPLFAAHPAKPVPLGRAALRVNVERLYRS